MVTSSTNPCIKGMTVDTCPHNPLLGCDCKANPPRKRCHTCSGFFHPALDVSIEVHGVSFHEGCYNRYEHYYGLDKPID
jgi:hypothetical protein